MNNILFTKLNKPEINILPEILLWLNFIERVSSSPPHNPETIVKSAIEAKNKNAPLPFIVTLCPAIENLNEPTAKGQTRRFIPLNENNPRLRCFIQELISFMVVTKETLDITPEIFLIFADILEPNSEKMFINSEEIEPITNQSITTINKMFFQIDQDNPGLFQKKAIRIPKVHRQSRIIEQSGKIGLNIKSLMGRVEFEIFDPNSPAHSIFERHIKLTRDDPSFVATGWQTQEGRETIHNRVRFMISQCWVDGIVLPKLMEAHQRKRFPQGMPSPIFVVSTTREAGIVLQQESFNFGAIHSRVLGIQSERHGVITIFKNSGGWESPPIEPILNVVKFK